MSGVLAYANGHVALGSRHGSVRRRLYRGVPFRGLARFIGHTVVPHRLVRRHICGRASLAVDVSSANGVVALWPERLGVAFGTVVTKKEP